MNQRLLAAVFRPHLAAGIAAAAALTALPAVADPAPAHGELAAAIRGAEFPCARVLQVSPAGEGRWVVECNSGTFRVTRDADGRFLVAPSG